MIPSRPHCAPSLLPDMKLFEPRGTGTVGPGSPQTYVMLKDVVRGIETMCLCRLVHLLSSLLAESFPVFTCRTAGGQATHSLRSAGWFLSPRAVNVYVSLSPLRLPAQGTSWLSTHVGIKSESDVDLVTTQETALNEQHLTHYAQTTDLSGRPVVCAPLKFLSCSRRLLPSLFQVLLSFKHDRITC
jgi:hypothetical protein